MGEIAYKIRNNLYLNITNRCTDDCTFCVRNYTDYVKGHNLKLEREPTAQEILSSIDDPKNYKEIVFCGYGEPTLRLDVVLEVALVLKQKGAYIRLVTNGHGNLINNRSISCLFSGLIDAVSVSLNVDSKEKYFDICRPNFGLDTFDKVLEFILECKKYVPKIEITCIQMQGVDIEQCKRIAKELGVDFRLRKLDVVG